MSFPTSSSSSSSSVPLPNLEGFNVAETAAQVKDKYNEYANRASPWVGRSAKKLAKFTQDNAEKYVPTISGYKVSVLSHNVKEAVVIALTVLTIVKVASAVFIAFSIKSALVAAVSLVLRDVVSRSMDDDLKEVGKLAPKNEKQGPNTSYQAPLELGKFNTSISCPSASSTAGFNSNANDSSDDEEGNHINHNPNSNTTNYNTSSKHGADSMPTLQDSVGKSSSAPKSSSVDAVLTFLFRNFVDKQFNKIEWTSFIYKA